MHESWKETEKLVKQFFDTIDFDDFIKNDINLVNSIKENSYIDIKDLMRSLRDYYDNHPELLPEIFEEDIFNFWDYEDFSYYIKDRYGYRIEDICTKHIYIYNLLGEDDKK